MGGAAWKLSHPFCISVLTFFTSNVVNDFGIDFYCFYIIVWKVFLLMCLPFSRPIFARFSYRMSSLFAFLLFRRTLGDTYSTGEIEWFSHIIQKTRFFMRSNSKTNIEMQVWFRIISLRFSWLFRHRFSHRFAHRFFIENGSPKCPGSVRTCLPFSRP